MDRLGLGVRINDAPAPDRVQFDFLAEHYLKADFGADAVRPKSENTIPIVEHYVRDYLSARWGSEMSSIGDCDEAGFGILSSLRGSLPRARSILMDDETWRGWSRFAVPGRSDPGARFDQLTASEVEALTFRGSRFVDVRTGENPTPRCGESDYASLCWRGSAPGK